MTNKEASEILDDYDINFDGHSAEVIAEAFDVAFKALEQEPKADPSKDPSAYCEDAISRREAILQIQRYGVGTFDSDDFMPEVAERYVIGLLKKLPSVQPAPIECDDAISRQAVLDATVKRNSIWNKITNSKGENLEEIISQLPPVNPQEPKTGHWIYDYVSEDGHKVYHCSECGCYLKPKHSEPLSSYKWCSLCGAKMESEDKE